MADALIYALWVDESHRGHEVGAHLLEAAEAQAKKHCAKSVALEWDNSDTPKWVLHWYEKLGYEERAFGRHNSLFVKQLILPKHIEHYGNQQKENLRQGRRDNRYHQRRGKQHDHWRDDVCHRTCGK